MASVAIPTIINGQPTRYQTPDNRSSVLSQPYGLHIEKARFWVDSVMNQLTTEQKIGQLMMVRAYSNRNDDYNNSIDQLITRFGVGGLCFFQGTDARQKELTQYWQECSSVPLFIAMDAENGPGMRLSGAFSFPEFMTMGALTNDSLIRVAGYRVGQMCAGLGVHINFSPVADVNNNPLNPVIHTRSFGEDPVQVAGKAVAFANGLQDAGIIATAKHFPGHGDTDSDSHYTLPVLNKSNAQLDSTELIPFRRLINEGVGAVMVGHLFVPSLDTTKNLAATFSPSIVGKLLKEELNFNGLVITDGLDMKGATMRFGPGEPALQALKAGSDILLLPDDVPAAILTIAKALSDTIINQSLIDYHCQRVLLAKYFHIAATGILRPHTPKADAAGADFDRALNRKILKESVILVTNQHDLLPLLRPDTMRIAIVSCGVPPDNAFSKMVQAYAACELFALPQKPAENDIKLLTGMLKSYNLIILNVVAKSQGSSRDYGVPPGTAVLVKALSASGLKTIVALFGSPYGTLRCGASDSIPALIVSPDNSIDSQELVPQMIFGALPFVGKLPVSLHPWWRVGHGIVTKPVGRLQYIILEELSINHKYLKKIDSIAIAGITAGAYPGCQVQLAVQGRVFYRKAFGNPAANDPTAVKTTDLYDLASLTKILATTLGVMKLSDESRINVQHPLSKYLSSLRNSNKEKLKIIDIMTHQAGLQPWIPFYKETLINPAHYYRDSLSADFSIKVADSLFLRTDFRDSIMTEILQSPLSPGLGYKYSDLGFILLKESIEEITGKPFDAWMTEKFYRQLSLTSLTYKPWTRFPSDKIMPTENDRLWRQQTIRGYVHDQATAMLGGVSGHAGLFGHANDVTVIMQMLLQEGSYGGSRFIEPKTVEKFCSAPFRSKNNRRGIGFDKPPLVWEKNGPVCQSASASSFGHSGFTGTYAWADPENRLVYVFLSNRICPDASNNLLSQLNIRTQIHELAYKAIGSAHTPDFTAYPEKVHPSELLINISKLGLLISTWH